MAWRRRGPTRAPWKVPRFKAALIRVPGVIGARSPTATPLNQSAAIIEIRNLSYAVNGRPIFAGLDMDVPRGRITAVMGPSGTGKTTLLRLITGQVLADSGSIVGAGQELGGGR